MCCVLPLECLKEGVPMKKLILLTIVTMLITFLSSANAGFTDVYSPPGSEAYITDILDQIYPGNFNNHHVQGASVYTSSAGVIATRVSDYGLGGSLNLVSGTPIRPTTKSGPMV